MVEERGQAQQKCYNTKLQFGWTTQGNTDHFHTTQKADIQSPPASWRPLTMVSNTRLVAFNGPLDIGSFTNLSQMKHKEEEGL